MRVDPIAAVTLNGPGKLTACATEKGGRRPLDAPDSVGNPFNASPFSGDLSVEGSAGDQRAGRGLIRQRNGVAFSFAFNLHQSAPQLFDHG